MKRINITALMQFIPIHGSSRGNAAFVLPLSIFVARSLEHTPTMRATRPCETQMLAWAPETSRFFASCSQDRQGRHAALNIVTISSSNFTALQLISS